MAKQIKAYVDVDPYVQVSHGRSADPASLLSSVLAVDDVGNTLAHLSEAATGIAAPARILSGPHGAGKSTSLAVIHALAANHDLRSRSQHHQIRSAASVLAGTKLIPVFVDPSETPVEDFKAALREGFAAATTVAAALGIPAAEWNAASVSEEPLPAVLELVPPEGRLLLIVDGLSTWLPTADREAARGAVSTLASLGERASSEPISILVALDEESLDGNTACLPLLKTFQVEYLPISTLAKLVDRFIFRKDAKQRTELGNVYDLIRQILPTFRWSREQTAMLYPLHPATIDVAGVLGKFAPSFSFLRFAANAGNRAKGRRELSLVVLDELFDSCEYELRKAPELASGFELYDDLVNSVVPRFTESQQRFWSKLVLKGLFLESLAGRAVTARDLADTMMLYEEGDADAGGRIVETILQAFAAHAPRQLVVESTGTAPTYRLPVAETGSGTRVVNEIASSIRADDPRLGDVLVGLGAARFPDWPVDLSDAAGYAHLDVPWRGTWRLGRLGFRVETELVEIPPLDAVVPLAAVEPTGDSAGDGSSTATAAAQAGTTSSVTFAPATELCELDWEVSLVPIGSPIDLREGPSSLVLWVPGEPDESDLQILRRLAALRAPDPRLDAPGLDRDAVLAEAEAEGGLVFHHLYLEKGRFLGPSWEVAGAEQAVRETLGGLLARVLDAPLAERYPQHPVFAGELDDSATRLLIEKFFIGGAGTPNVQQAAAALAAPLELAEASEHGHYRFNPSSESVLSLPCNIEPLRLAEAAGDAGVPMAAVYQELRREPYGLQRSAQRLILAAMVASGRLKLVGPNGELTAAGLETAGDLDEYTHVMRSGLTLYPNETLLEWSRLVTDTDELDDLVTAEGRQAVRRALEGWLERWRDMDLKARFSDVPPEAATRRTWQLIAASKQYFDSSARQVQSILAEEVTLEDGLGRIVTAFAANPTIYQRALRDLKMLTSFIDWTPYFSSAKEYVLSADRTSEARIEAARVELLDFIASPHRLLDENKRRRFETVYESFQKDYAEYYVAAHDVHVGSRSDFEALDSYLDSNQWMSFQLLSHVRVVNERYYTLAMEMVQNIRDLSCELPTRELLIERPSCVCGFRLGNADGVARMMERLRLVVDRGTAHHILTVRQFRSSILVGLRQVQSDSAYADASVPLIALLSSTEAASVEITPSTIDLINRCVIDTPLPLSVAAPPILEPGQPMTRETIRTRVQEWLDGLPGDDGVLIEIGRLLPAASDE